MMKFLFRGFAFPLWVAMIFGDYLRYRLRSGLRYWEDYAHRAKSRPLPCPKCGNRPAGASYTERVDDTDDYQFGCYHCGFQAAKKNTEWAALLAWNRAARK